MSFYLFESVRTHGLAVIGSGRYSVDLEEYLQTMMTEQALSLPLMLVSAGGVGMPHGPLESSQASMTDVGSLVTTTPSIAEDIDHLRGPVLALLVKIFI